MQDRPVTIKTLFELTLSTRRLILAATVVHLTTAVVILLVGRLALLPAMFDANGIGAFASDGYRYQSEAVSLLGTLWRGGAVAWLTASPQFHVKIYSLSFAVFGPIFGMNILAAEPINSFYYVSTLILIKKIGTEGFNRRAGVIAAAVVALWPSFLLHSTQLLRDPLFIIAMLALVLLLAKFLLRAYSWSRGLATGTVCAGAVSVLWIVRADIWYVVRAVVFLGVALLLVRQFCKRRVLVGNMLGVSVLFVATMSIPPIAAAIQERTGAFMGISIEEQRLPLWARIARRRQRFIMNGRINGGSNIDLDVEFANSADVARYLPRAVEIGYFAPFPEIWFAPGRSVGGTGRVLIGLETLLTYVIELLAFICLCRWWRSLPSWLLSLTAATGLTALGLVVVNVGTLYRLRFAFWMMLVIPGMAGLVHILWPLEPQSRAPDDLASVPDLERSA